MKWTPTCTKIIRRIYNASTKLLLHQLNVDHLKMVWCRYSMCVIVSTGVVFLLSLILCVVKSYSGTALVFCTSSFVNSRTTSCVVGIHFPFKVAAERSCKLLHSQAISFVSYTQWPNQSDSKYNGLIVHSSWYTSEHLKLYVYIFQNIQKRPKYFKMNFM